MLVTEHNGQATRSSASVIGRRKGGCGCVVMLKQTGLCSVGIQTSGERFRRSVQVSLLPRRGETLRQSCGRIWIRCRLVQVLVLVMWLLLLLLLILMMMMIIWPGEPSRLGVESTWALLTSYIAAATGRPAV